MALLADSGLTMLCTIDRPMICDHIPSCCPAQRSVRLKNNNPCTVSLGMETRTRNLFPPSYPQLYDKKSRNSSK